MVGEVLPFLCFYKELDIFQEGDPNFHSSSSFDVKKLFLIACDLDN